MPRYIDADGLLAKVPQANADIFENCRNCTCLDSEQIKELINAEPTADVAEVKRGHWIIDRKYGNDVMSGEKMVICSVCGNGIFCGKQNYCPNCGALMEGEK